MNKGYWELNDGSSVGRGVVPVDARVISKSEYDAFVSSMPVPDERVSDVQKLVAWAKREGII